jgi:hypothetical protein
VRQKIDFKIDQILINGATLNVFKPAWLLSNHGSCESDTLSHNKLYMAWFGVKMAWLLYHLVQINNFWTSNIPICAKWQHLRHGHFQLFQGQQLSYIVLHKHTQDRLLLLFSFYKYKY